MKQSGCMRLVAGVLIVTMLAMIAYPALIRPWHLRWGSTNAELAQALPGDELIAAPERSVTRAITIDAPAEQVWAWVAQSGADQAGLYSYTLLEAMAACPIVNADTIHPEWQDPQPGDTWAMCPGGSGPPPYQVALVDPGRALVLGHAENGGWFDTWAFVVQPLDEDTTRLIHRSRTAQDLAWVKAVEAPMFVMERGMLRGIRARAEGQALDPSEEDPFRWMFGVLFAGYLLIRLVYQRRRAENAGPAGANSGLQTALLWLATITTIPAAIYPLSEMLDGFHIGLPGGVRLLGALIFLAGDLLFWAAHRALGRNWSAQVTLQEAHRLVTHGVYRRTRHPMYTALFGIGTGMALLGSNWLVGLPFLVVFAALYLTRVDDEEKLMLERFGAEYRQYMGRSGRLLPKL